MYEKDFQKLISTKKIANQFMIYGSCRLSLLIYSNYLKQLQKSDETLTLRDGEYKLNLAKDFLESSSLFAQSKLLILELEKPISAKDLKELIPLCNNENKLILIISSSKALPDLEKIFLNNFLRVFEKKTSYEQIELLKICANYYNVNINENALILLQKNYEFDLYKAGCELLKYSNSTILEDELKSHLENDGDISFDDFFYNFINAKDINDNIYKALNSFDSFMIINSMYSKMMLIFTINSFIKLNGYIDYKIALGYTPPKDVANKLENTSRLLGDKIEQILDLLLKTEYQMKTSQTQSTDELLISSLLKLNSIIHS